MAAQCSTSTDVWKPIVPKRHEIHVDYTETPAHAYHHISDAHESPCSCRFRETSDLIDRRRRTMTLRKHRLPWHPDIISIRRFTGVFEREWQSPGSFVRSHIFDTSNVPTVEWYYSSPLVGHWENDCRDACTLQCSTSELQVDFHSSQKNIFNSRTIIYRLMYFAVYSKLDSNIYNQNHTRNNHSFLCDNYIDCILYLLYSDSFIQYTMRRYLSREAASVTGWWCESMLKHRPQVQSDFANANKHSVGFSFPIQETRDVLIRNVPII